ncbi:HNH endonuclease [Methylobacterium soli]|uniref:HNH endonuclease n=1 Tax=Methylobacterium soli TaxID=553447 RepID=A0A6L3T5N5_9HYPH|nr:HNH endonuclease [Methylobacterium soli]KAB1081720.1 HNH endonuclease [Methylobacterium soli]GJE46190.1 hypothetical protein AEGHOMDF_5390 [Methylobacterium soli]
MAQRAPRICGCGHKIAADEACPCQVQRAREAERNRPTARERGYTSKWERESKAFLALPMNQICACGCGRPATVVDHRQAHKGNQRLFWARWNWQPMAKGCNSRKAVREEGAFGRAVRSEPCTSR